MLEFNGQPAAAEKAAHLRGHLQQERLAGLVGRGAAWMGRREIDRKKSSMMNFLANRVPTMACASLPVDWKHVLHRFNPPAHGFARN